MILEALCRREKRRVRLFVLNQCPRVFTRKKCAPSVGLLTFFILIFSYFPPFPLCPRPSRLSTIVNADSILCVQAGQVVESGSHSDLLAMGGVYSSLVSKQVEALDMANNSTSNGGEKP